MIEEKPVLKSRQEFDSLALIQFSPHTQMLNGLVNVSQATTIIFKE